MLNDERNYYYDLYHESKLTNEQVRQFIHFENLSDKEIAELIDMIFDLAVMAKKIITEINE